MKLLVETFWAAGKVVSGAGRGKQGSMQWRWMQAGGGRCIRQASVVTAHCKCCCLHSFAHTPAAVCHGPCALTTAVGPDNQSIIKGRQVRCAALPSLLCSASWR